MTRPSRHGGDPSYVVVSVHILVAVTDKVTLLFGLVLCMSRHRCCHACVWLALVHSLHLARPEVDDNKYLSGFAARAVGTEQTSKYHNRHLPVLSVQNSGRAFDIRATSLCGRTLCTFETGRGGGNGFHRKAAS